MVERDKMIMDTQTEAHDIETHDNDDRHNDTEQATEASTSHDDEG